ncbi:MAG: exosortase N [Chitinophagaceae bacterium]
MNASVNISLPRRLAVNPGWLIIAGYLLTGGLVLQEYLILRSMNCILGLAALFFVWRFRQGGCPGSGLGWLAVFFMVLCILVPVKTFLYFTMAAAMLFSAGCFYGSTSLLAFFTMALMSPVFQYLTNTFSFPIRLALTKLAGHVFNLAGIATIARGNLIIRDGQEFSVDPGCMGLSMMEASLLLGVMLVAFFQHQYRRRLRGAGLLLYFTLVVLLNIIANLFRILVLVHFSILPATLSHEVTGLVCLLLYVFIPAVFLSRWLVRRARPWPAAIPVVVPATPKKLLPPVALLAAVAGLAVYVARTDTHRRIDLSAVQQTSGYTATHAAQGVVKLEDGKSLVYIKYIRGFYDTDHTPITCWKGSGYAFEQVQQEHIGGHAIYTALLVSGGEKLYSAWWYSNGTSILTGQLAWRWDMLRSRSNYALVNVTCASRQDLDKAISKITGERTLLPFFKKPVYQ